MYLCFLPPQHRWEWALWHKTMTSFKSTCSLCRETCSSFCSLKFDLWKPLYYWISGTRVLGEVEKDSFIALPGKGGHNRLVPSKLCPNLGLQETCEESYSWGWGWGERRSLLIRIRVCAGSGFLQSRDHLEMWWWANCDFLWNKESFIKSSICWGF